MFLFLNIPLNLRELYLNQIRASIKTKTTSTNYSNVATIRSSAGVPFKSFAKSRRFAKDLYKDFVATSLGVDLYVEAWRKGTGAIPSNCTQTNKLDDVAFLFFNWDFAECGMWVKSMWPKSISRSPRWTIIRSGQLAYRQRGRHLGYAWATSIDRQEFYKNLILYINCLFIFSS